MALAMTPATMAPAQDDTMDLDIDMDVDDMAGVPEDEMLEEGEEPEFIPTGHQVATGEVAAIYLEDPSQEPQWEKVHIRGVDDLSTDHIRTFASDYFSDAGPYVQWVDDTSANLVYKEKAMARSAILSFVQQPISSEEIQNNPFELRTAKPLVTNPGSLLTVRVAMMGDRKKRNAKDASRYYLLHPEADPEERIRRQNQSRGDTGDYKRRRFDDREHNRRRRHQDDNADSTNDFEASMYDDAPADSNLTKDRGRDLFSRITKPRNRSASPTIPVSDSESDTPRPHRRRNGYRDRASSPRNKRNNAGRELFDDPGSDIRGGNGMRSDQRSFVPRSKSATATNQSSSEINRGLARQLRADLKAAQQTTSTTITSSPVARSHRRSRAIDVSRVEEDLAERFGRKSISQDSTKSVMQETRNSGKELFGDRDGSSSGAGSGGAGGFSIKGASAQGMSIKGRADVKELFPDRFSSGGAGTHPGGPSARGGNKGRELFDDPVRVRGVRQRAGDLFD